MKENLTGIPIAKYWYLNGYLFKSFFIEGYCVNVNKKVAFLQKDFLSRQLLFQLRFHLNLRLSIREVPYPQTFNM